MFTVIFWPLFVDVFGFASLIKRPLRRLSAFLLGVSPVFLCHGKLFTCLSVLNPNKYLISPIFNKFLIWNLHDWKGRFLHAPLGIIGRRHAIFSEYSLVNRKSIIKMLRRGQGKIFRRYRRVLVLVRVSSRSVFDLIQPSTG